MVSTFPTVYSLVARFISKHRLFFCYRSQTAPTQSAKYMLEIYLSAKHRYVCDANLPFCWLHFHNPMVWLGFGTKPCG